MILYVGTSSKLSYYLQNDDVRRHNMCLRWLRLTLRAYVWLHRNADGVYRNMMLAAPTGAPGRTLALRLILPVGEMGHIFRREEPVLHDRSLIYRIGTGSYFTN